MARRQVFNGVKARELRESKDMSVAGLHARINEIGSEEWALNTIHGGENGRPVGLHLSHAWAQALGVHWRALMTDAPEDGDTP